MQVLEFTAHLSREPSALHQPRRYPNATSSHSSDGTMSRGLSRNHPIEINDDEDDGPKARSAFHQSDPVSTSPNTIDTKPTVSTQNPVYLDPKFKILMYRGPGYEDFPIAFDSNPRFKDLLKDWEKKNQPLDQNGRISQKRQAPGYGFDVAPFPPTSLESEDSDTVSVPDFTPFGTSYTEFENMCLQHTLQVFPKIEHEFVREKCREWLSKVDQELLDVQTDPTAEIITQIAELDEYPEEQQSKKRKRPVDEDEDGLDINWGQNDIENKSEIYYFDAMRLLGEEFPYIPSHAMHQKLRVTGKLYDTYRYFESYERTYNTITHKPYRHLRSPRQQLEAKYARKPKGVRPPKYEYIKLVNELQAAKKACQEDIHQEKRRKDEEDAEATNLRVHTEAGMLIECQCCFDDEIPINRAVPCNGEDVHFYCRSCVKNQAASQIGQLKYQMNCVYSGAKSCDASLLQTAVKEALDEKLLAKLEQLQVNAEINNAGIEGLEECPFCDFKAICDPVDIDREFKCANPDCLRISCRLCHEISHIPKTCEEAKADRGADLRHDVEEAMTAALVRRCPNTMCKTPIIKEFGCNKVMCGKCQTLMCYICGKDITSAGHHGYDHFQRQGATCKLHDDTNQQVLEEQQVKKARQETIKRLREENPNVDEATLQVPDGPAVQPRGLPSRPPRINHPLLHAQAIHAMHEAAANLANAVPPRPGPPGRLPRPHERHHDLGWGDFDRPPPPYIDHQINGVQNANNNNPNVNVNANINANVNANANGFHGAMQYQEFFPQQIFRPVNGLGNAQVDIMLPQRIQVNQPPKYQPARIGEQQIQGNIPNFDGFGDALDGEFPQQQYQVQHPNLRNMPIDPPLVPPNPVQPQLIAGVDGRFNDDLVGEMPFGYLAFQQDNPQLRPFDPWTNPANNFQFFDLWDEDD